ncbi:CENP-C_C domain-containing protein [Trichonephila inaurata madagascariensis]|uniref:CENP-C_C domain-containing protein n=1 Tax=Trichonephila inaurata madagascariensis TaxID=2747483 RepID=A0A8X6X3Z8_9ARAC|nr:CENP-C_C domain-containing protein [Trichonephila inaurata madagascariensis]
MKTKNSDSSSEVPCTVADVSKSRRHSSVTTLPLRESPQISSSNVNKTLNTSVKRHKKYTTENEILYDKSAKQSLIEPVQSPVTTVVTNEEAVRESNRDVLDIHGRTLITSEFTEGSTAVSKATSVQQKSPSKPEESPVPKGRPRMPKEASIEEKSPTKAGHSPVTRGRSTTSTEAPSKPEHSRVTRGRSRISVYHLRPLNSSSVPEESSVKRKRPRGTVEHFEPEEPPSEPEQSPVKKKRTKIPRGLDQKKSASKRPSRSENDNEGPLLISPSVTRRHADSSVKMSQKQAYQTLSNVQVEYDSSKTSPVKSKSSMATYDIPHQNHLGPEASVIESETLPKKITQVTGDQLNHSEQKNLPAKAKASKNKSAASVDNNEVLSDLGENSMPIVKRKENRMTVSGKNNRHPRSPPKRTTSRTHDKESKDANSNGNISEPACGLRRSSRFRVPPLDFWRNERLVFETLPSGEVQCSIDKGTEEDKSGLIQMAKKAERRAQMKKKKAHTVKNTPILDTRTGETVHALLHRPFESLQWSMEPNEVERPSPYTMVKAFESNSTSFGFFKISPFAIKETQYSPLENLHFVLMKGHLEVVIQNTTFTFKAGDSWMVPLGAPYSIKNCSRLRALLSFTAFKSPFYQHQFAE